MEKIKATGEVKRVLSNKGYGFISVDAEYEHAAGKEILFNHGEVIGDIRFHEVRPGDKVSFIIGERKGRPSAQNVIVERRALLERVRGEIRSLLPRGFGFVRTASTREDIFFHCSELTGGIDFTDLRLRDKVTFLIRERVNGMRYAIDVALEPDEKNQAI